MPAPVLTNGPVPDTCPVRARSSAPLTVRVALRITGFTIVRGAATAWIVPLLTLIAPVPSMVPASWRIAPGSTIVTEPAPRVSVPLVSTVPKSSRSVPDPSAMATVAPTATERRAPATTTT